MKSIPKTVCLAVAVVIVSQLTIGTSPLPPPYHQYRVSGTITRSSGLPLNDFVVTLKGKFPYTQPDSLIPVAFFRVLSEYEHYPAITDTSGRFFAIVATMPKADSLVVEISAADKPTVRGEILAVPQQGIALTTSYIETEPGCSGCTRESTYKTQVLGYQYALPEQTVHVPF